MMEITEVKIKKLELEKELYRLITEFENQTGVCITGIDLPSVHKHLDTRGSISYYRGGKITASVEVMS